MIISKAISSTWLSLILTGLATRDRPMPDWCWGVIFLITAAAIFMLSLQEPKAPK